jgi:SH3-like domain-containing protein
MRHRTLQQWIRVGTLSLAFLYGTAVASSASDYVSVVKDGVNLRSGPDISTDVLFQLPGGYPLRIIERRGEWIHVLDYEQDKGWIYASLVSTTPHVIVKVANGNVRSGPGTENEIVGKVVRDVILQKIDQKGDWLQISHPQLSGWVHKQLVWP